MLAYPITLEDDDGTVLATSPDFPELATFGDDREEAVARAVHALEEAIAGPHTRPQGHSHAVTGRDLCITADADFGKGDAVPGDEGAGRRQGGTGPPPGGGTCLRWTGYWMFSTGRGLTRWTPPWAPLVGGYT